MKDKPIYEQFDITMASDNTQNHEGMFSVGDVSFDYHDYITVDDTIDLSSITIDTGVLSQYDVTTYNDISIEREGRTPIKVAETLEKIMERLSIIEPDFDKMERYPALREAYNNYRAIEALIAGDESTD